MKFDFIPDNVSKFDNVYDVLKERGFIQQCTDEEKVRKLLQDEKVKFYIGFDPYGRLPACRPFYAGHNNDVYAEIRTHPCGRPGRRHGNGRRPFRTEPICAR